MLGSIHGNDASEHLMVTSPMEGHHSPLGSGAEDDYLSLILLKLSDPITVISRKTHGQTARDIAATGRRTVSLVLDIAEYGPNPLTGTVRALIHGKGSQVYPNSLALLRWSLRGLD